MTISWIMNYYLGAYPIESTTYTSCTAAIFLKDLGSHHFYKSDDDTIFNKYVRVVL
jgi:hypothetical protein